MRLLAGDFNNDGRLDLVGAANTKQVISLAGDGAGGMVLTPTAGLLSMTPAGLNIG